MTYAFLFVKSLCDLLSQRTQLYLLFILQLQEKVADFVLAHQSPFLVLSTFDILNLTLYFVSLHVLLGTSQLLLHSAQINYLTGLLLGGGYGLVDYLCELFLLMFMFLESLIFYFFSFSLILHEFAIPVGVEVGHFFQMGCFHFTSFFVERLQ